MDEQKRPSSEPPHEPPAAPKAKDKTFKSWLPVLAIAAAFLVGFLPMWFKSHHLGYELDRTQATLRLTQLQLTLANAAFDARRGEYEKARQEASDFFTVCRTELDRGAGSALPATGRPEVEKLLTQRDDLITLLARGDAASAERIANLYMGFRSAVEPK